MGPFLGSYCAKNGIASGILSGLDIPGDRRIVRGDGLPSQPVAWYGLALLAPSEVSPMATPKLAEDDDDATLTDIRVSV